MLHCNPPQVEVQIGNRGVSPPPASSSALSCGFVSCRLHPQFLGAAAKQRPPPLTAQLQASLEPDRPAEPERTRKVIFYRLRNHSYTSDHVLL